VRILLLALLMGCRVGFDVVTISTSASLVTGVISADVNLCADQPSIATWVLLRTPSEPSADEVRALAAASTTTPTTAPTTTPTTVIASGSDLRIRAHDCATATARVLDPISKPADPVEEQRPVYLYAVLDAIGTDVVATASASGKMHATYELTKFTDENGHVDQYWIHYPEGYYRDPTTPRPTLIFLHGWGEATHAAFGDVPVEQMVERSGFLELYEQRAPTVIDQPFIVIAPQCDENHYPCWGWTHATGMVEYALDHAESQLRAPIDGSRLYATGISTGGEGAWRIAMDLERVRGHEGHHRIAATVPVASTFDPDLPVASYFTDHICDASGAAVWAFHATADDTQSVTNDENMVAAYNRCASPRRPAVLSRGDWRWQGQSHAGWVEAYGNSHGFENDGQTSIYAWMLLYRRP
jgi:poly(3-hydroxybutyrate) depolymerase